MKLSSLNRFKGKTVFVKYLDCERNSLCEIEGILEEVTEDYITIEQEIGLENIPIPDIRVLQEVEIETEKEKKEVIPVTKYKIHEVGNKSPIHVDLKIKKV
jgi:Leucine-rich repeat (LRR) protein